MAGLYPDIPGTRFALDQDGTVMKWRNFTTGSGWTDITGSIAETQKVNTANYSEIPTPTGGNYIQASLAFPEARSLTGMYIHFGTLDTRGGVANFVWEYSIDTTDGTDGTWTAFTVTFANFSMHNNLSQTSKPYYRSDIATFSLVNVKGIRARWNESPAYNTNTRMCVWHVYGSRPLTGVDRLAFWHPSSDQAIAAAALDFGDIAQGSSVTRQYRIKNLSASLTASSITVQVSDLLPEYSGTGLQVSSDNVTYQASVSIGNLAPGSISSVLYVRRTVAAGEATTQRQARLLANAAAWS